MMYDRLVNFHGLNNLIWVFNTNEFKDGVDPHDRYYPGDDVVDIIATDVYTEGFSMENYEQMLELAGNKPIALGEVGQVPGPDIIEEQPKWTWFMQWGDPGGFGAGFRSAYDVYNSETAITLEKLPWVDMKDPGIHYPILK